MDKAPGLSRGVQFTDDDGKTDISDAETDIIDFRSIMKDIPNLNLWSDESLEKNTKLKTDDNLNELNEFEESVIPGVSFAFSENEGLIKPNLITTFFLGSTNARIKDLFDKIQQICYEN